MQTKHLCVLNYIRTKGEASTVPPVQVFLLTVPRQCFFCRSFLLFMFRICHVFLSVHCSLVVTCWDRSFVLDVLLYFLSLSNVVSWVRVLVLDCIGS